MRPCNGADVQPQIIGSPNLKRYFGILGGTAPDEDVKAIARYNPQGTTTADALANSLLLLAGSGRQVALLFGFKQELVNLIALGGSTQQRLYLLQASKA